MEYLGCTMMYAHVKSVPDATLEETDDRKALFDALGIETETSDLLASTLQLHFRGGSLCVAETARQMPDLAGPLRPHNKVLHPGGIPFAGD